MKTRYIDVVDVRKLLKKKGVACVIREMAQCIREDFGRWKEFDKTVRVASHSKDGVIELMPISDQSRYAFKYVNGHPDNAQRSLPTVMAFGALSEVDSGYPLLLSELTITTALRTAATSALAAQFMARKNIRVMALIGNGAQSEFQALAFHHMLGIEEIRAYDIDLEASAKLMRNLESVAGLNIRAVSSTAQAVRGADIVTTLTADKRRATILTPDMIEPGVHLNAVGGDCPGKTELHPDILQGARLVVEFAPQTRVEGESQQLAEDASLIELWQLVSGERAGRVSDQEVTVFDSVGFALEDFSALRYLYAQAAIQDIGRDMDLIPEMVDPRNLYGTLHQ